MTLMVWHLLIATERKISEKVKLMKRVEFLDDFSAAKPESKKPTEPSTSAQQARAEKSTAAPAPSASLDEEDALLDEELAKELEKGMANFFSGLENSVSLNEKTDPSHSPLRHISDNERYTA